MKNGVKKFARVVVPSPLKDALIYSVPESLENNCSAGMRVMIPLRKRKVTGVIFELLADSPISQTKEIIARLDEAPVIDATLIKLTEWIANYYLVPLGAVLAAMLPAGMRAPMERTVTVNPGSLPVCDPLEKNIIDAIGKKNGKITVRTLSRRFDSAAFYRALRRLEDKGAVAIFDHTPGRRRRSKNLQRTMPEPTPHAAALTLTAQQQKAFGEIAERVKRGGFETFLLYGATGSGKTEVYLRAIEHVKRAGGKRSLILIPEISLTPQLIDRLDQRFPGRVGVLHSALTEAERWAQWWQILRGQVDVVVGARSAVFAPLADLGLIIADEEHDTSYKQEEGLRYNGRDLAVVRGMLTGCPVILGSATPSVESFHNALRGHYRLLEMPKRVHERAFPDVEVIDLRSEFAAPPVFEDGARSLFSRRLAQLVKKNFQRRRQTLIFLNRRGFANYLQCMRCGHVVRCPHCSVTLTLHLEQQSVACHHCEFRRPVKESCPQCGRGTLSGIGIGTEQVETLLHRLVPEARVARMDRDTTSKRGSHESLIRTWEKGGLDVLVGTQMVTKGHDVGAVTLVGALLADLSLNLPDFRAAERTYQLLSQVAGRSGRGDDRGHVLIQTYTPDHYAIGHMMTHDYRGFFDAELEFRRALGYPPFTRLISLRLDGPKNDAVSSQAKTLAAILRRQQAENANYRSQIEVLGPAPAPIEKLRNRYRWQILLKGKQSALLHEFARHARAALGRAGAVRLHIDVDPYSML